MEKRERGRPRKFENRSMVCINIEQELLDRINLHCFYQYIERTTLINKIIREYLDYTELPEENNNF